MNTNVYKHLIDSPVLMESRFISTENDDAHLAEIEAAIKSFVDPLNAKQVSTLIQLYTVEHLISKRSRLYFVCIRQLKTLVWLDRIDEALRYARLPQEPKHRFERLMAIYQTQQEQGIYNQELLDELWKMSWDTTWESQDALHPIFPDSDRMHALRQLIPLMINASRLDDALTIAHGIDQVDDRAEKLATVAAAVFPINADQALQIFTEAFNMVRTFEYDRRRNFALYQIAETVVTLNDSRLDGLLNIILEDIPVNFNDGEFWKYSRKRQVVVMLAKRNDSRAERYIQQAFEQVKQADNPKYISSSVEELCAIGLMLSQINDDRAESIFDKAWNLAITLENTDHMGFYLEAWDESAREHNDYIATKGDRTRVVKGIVESLIEAKWFDKALSVTESLKDTYVYQDTLNAIARASVQQLLQDGKVDEALQVATQIDDIGERSDAFLHIGHKLVLLEDARTESLLNQSLELSQSYRAAATIPFDDWIQPQCNPDLALVMARINKERAEQLLIDSQDLSHYRIIIPELLSALAEILAVYNRLEAASSVVQLLNDDYKRSFAEIRILLAKLGNDWQDSDLEQAFDITEHLKSNLDRVNVINEIATFLVHMNRVEEARRFIELIEGIGFQQKALCNIAIQLAELGKNAEAKEIADTLLYADDRATALDHIGEKNEKETHRIAWKFYIRAISDQNRLYPRNPRNTVTKDMIASLLAANQRSYLETLIDWWPIFEDFQDGLSLIVLRETARIMAWLYPKWNKIYTLFETFS